MIDKILLIMVFGSLKFNCFVRSGKSDFPENVSESLEKCLKC